MEVDIFKEILVPVIGGLGIFLLGLEFMDSGIQALSVNKMREWLAKVAGTPVKGLMAGTVITGVIQSSTAMTVMTVGLVNAGVLSLRSAISVIMGANIGTTLGNGLIALPLGPIGLLFSGIFACVYCFARKEKTKNIALASMGFSLIFYGLNLMTGGLKPLRNMPEVMAVLQRLDSSNILGVISCALIAALITAMIHSSSATIGIVMGLGASGVLPWQTAIAFAIGADLGTTITSWIASLNLSKNAKRTAYAHIAFNFIGVCVVLALFFPAIRVLHWGLGLFGIDPARAVMVDGQPTYPMVPVAVGLFSIVFNIFNVCILFPFVGTFERVLSKVGADKEDEEDWSTPRFLTVDSRGVYAQAVPAVQQEIRRQLAAAALFVDIARGKEDAPKEIDEHAEAVDSLSREIRAYSAHLFTDDLNREQMDLVASLIEEVDFTSALTEQLHQVARRAQREQFSPASQVFLEEALEKLDQQLEVVGAPVQAKPEPRPTDGAQRSVESLRWQVIDTPSLPAGEKGALLAILGSIERSESLVARIQSERASVDRGIAAMETTEA
ncbi:Na/Pi cotransporter family protein [Luteococcus sp. OSA5]|uniref:Na/Pi cotransporter family protein n=1 Tax=Luteococcus sp. OSA5 TaxID=3401630 RepID=UPI003B4295F8